VNAKIWKQPQRGCAKAGRNAVGVGEIIVVLPKVARRLATLGFETESRWDSQVRRRWMLVMIAALSPAIGAVPLESLPVPVEPDAVPSKHPVVPAELGVVPRGMALVPAEMPAVPANIAPVPGGIAKLTGTGAVLTEMDACSGGTDAIPAGTTACFTEQTANPDARGARPASREAPNPGVDADSPGANDKFRERDKKRAAAPAENREPSGNNDSERKKSPTEPKTGRTTFTEKSVTTLARLPHYVSGTVGKSTMDGLVSNRVEEIGKDG
jgi:hypothetical protein